MIYAFCFVCETQMGGKREPSLKSGGHAPWTPLGAATDCKQSVCHRYIVALHATTFFPKMRVYIIEMRI